jgi:prepilin-type N-terminal cleavage/methylation domain-containing protein
MNTLFGEPSAPAPRPRAKAGFTLVEMMTTSAIFGLAVVGFVYCQMLAMRQDQWVNGKVGASEQARMSFNDLIRDIRNSKIVTIGTFPSSGFSSISNFTPIAFGTSQIGNAVQLCLTTNTSTVWVYYFDTNRGNLLRQHTGDSNNTLLAQYLTNTMTFKAEDYTGTNILTTNSHKEVIHVQMQFYMYQYPITKIGPGCYYDFYELNFRATPQAPDGM